MDVLAHGLWGAVAFYPKGTKSYAAALLLGMAPDLLSFGVYHAAHPRWLKLRLAGEISGPPPLSILPEFVFHAYNLTHSLIIWGALFLLIWMITKRPPWIWLAWGLHVLSDIPTHSSSYFLPPYLWPFPTPFVEGISWNSPWFMMANYGALLAAYAGIFFYVRKRNFARSGKDKDGRTKKMGRAGKQSLPDLSGQS